MMDEVKEQKENSQRRKSSRGHTELDVTRRDGQGVGVIGCRNGWWVGVKKVKHNQEGDDEENKTWKGDKRAHMTRGGLLKESQLK